MKYREHQTTRQHITGNLVELFLPNPIELHDAGHCSKTQIRQIILKLTNSDRLDSERGVIPIHVPRDIDDDDEREQEPKDVNLDHHQQHKGTAETGKAGHDLLGSGRAEMFADTKHRDRGQHSERSNGHHDVGDERRERERANVRCDQCGVICMFQSDRSNEQCNRRPVGTDVTT